MMKLSEFKAQYFPWSKAYKEREKKEREALEESEKRFWNEYRQSKEQLARLRDSQNAYVPPINPLVKQPEPTRQSTSSAPSFTENVAASVLGNMIGNALSDSFSSSSSSSRSSDSDSSSSWSSSSDSSSSWSDSSSSSWSDSSSSSWD